MNCETCGCQRVIMNQTLTWISVAARLCGVAGCGQEPSTPLFSKNNLYVKTQWYCDVSCRLRSSVGLRRSPEGPVVCIVARFSMHTGCALCACGGVSVCLCVCSDTSYTQESRLKKKLVYHMTTPCLPGALQGNKKI
jgi:hypothetical protein